VGVVHQRLGRHDQHDGAPLATRGGVLHRRRKRACLRVDGGSTLRRLGLDVAPDRGFLAPTVVVFEVVLVLLANAGKRRPSSSARRRPACRRLLADGVKELLRAGGAPDDALGARQNVLLVLSHDALRHGVARVTGANGRLAVRLLPAAVLAIAQVVVGRDVFVVFTRRPHPSCQPSSRNNNRQGEWHPVAQGAAAAARVLAAVVAVVVEAHDSCVLSAWYRGWWWCRRCGRRRPASCMCCCSGGWEQGKRDACADASEAARESCASDFSGVTLVLPHSVPA
jgi:hypothetical protein